MHWNMLLLSLVIYFSVGIAAGLMSGLLGVGGGLVTVPGLLFAFQWENMNPAIAMHVALGTSLMTMVPITFRSLRSHMQHDHTFISIYKKMVPAIIAGVITGGIISRYLNSTVLKIIFGVFVLTMAAVLFFQNGEVVVHKKLPGRLGMLLAGGFVGVQSGMLGVGGGSFTVPFLTHRGVDIRVALIVSVTVAMTVATMGAIAYMLTGLDVSGLPQWSTGFIYWPAFIGLAVGGVLMAPQGVRLSRHISKQKLKMFFVIFLIFVGVHMLYSVG